MLVRCAVATYHLRPLQGEANLKKWLVVSAAVLGTVVAVATITHYQMARARAARIEALAKLPTRERNLIIFDAYCRQLEAHYFDHRFFEKPEWPKIRAEWREKAAAAENSPNLYFSVLAGLSQQFHQSHVLAMPPPDASASGSGKAPVATPALSTEERDIQAKRNREFASGPGYTTAPIRRPGGSGGEIVVDVITGSPADRAGIQPGWVFSGGNTDTRPTTVHFSGKFIKLTPEQATEFEKSGQVSLPNATREQLESFVADRSTSIEYDLAELAPHSNYDARTLEGGLSYIRFDDFADSKIVDRVLEAIDAAAPNGIIIDLRQNSGGLNTGMHRLVSRLLGHHEFIGSSHNYKGILEEWTAPFGKTYDGPIAILIGPSSASAAEITAAAIQDHKRGKIIGRTSQGAVMDAMQYPLPDGGTAFIPIRDFMRAGERHIEGAGVAPDIYVMPTLADVRAGRDPALEQAVLALKK